MLPTTMSLVGTVILLLDIFAIVSVLMGSSEVMRGPLWIAVILLLPVVGMVLYFLIGREAERRAYEAGLTDCEMLLNRRGETNHERGEQCSQGRRRRDVAVEILSRSLESSRKTWIRSSVRGPQGPPWNCG